MKLDAWLRQEHTLAERLRLVERLAQALNEVHDRGEILVALQPERIEVGTDLRCDLGGARRGTAEPGYAAPERLEGQPPSTAADIYAAGAVAWEVLVGRPCGELPAPLGDVAPQLPRELAAAVMGCLERSPQWRPKDLTYLAQLSAAHQKAHKKTAAPAPAPTPSPLRAAGAGPARTPPRRASRSHLPLLVAALLLAGAAGGSYWWIQREGGDRAPRPAPTPGRADRAEASPSPAAASSPLAPTPLPSPPAERPTTPAETLPAPTPPPSGLGAAPTPTPTPTPATTPATLPAPAPTPTPAPAPPAAATSPPRGRDAVTPGPLEPVVLSTLSPPTVRRPGKVLLDLRGSGFRPDLRARVLPLREVPRGILVTRQKWVSPTLITVLLELDATVTPGGYAVVLEDPEGGQTKPLTLTVAK